MLKKLLMLALIYTSISLPTFAMDVYLDANLGQTRSPAHTTLDILKDDAQAATGSQSLTNNEEEEEEEEERSDDYADAATGQQLHADNEEEKFLPDAEKDPAAKQLFEIQEAKKNFKRHASGHVFWDITCSVLTPLTAGAVVFGLLYMVFENTSMSDIFLRLR